ncbi:DinB family protein [Peribacillus simplex]|uniref:DinB family protein n=1 Tax=Peribacillus simplex TaxID=1478 RepID=UPI003D298245
MDDEVSLFIPEGFNNNIKWNLGHIYVVQEKFAFNIINERTTMQKNIFDLFSIATKPTDWGEKYYQRLAN